MEHREPETAEYILRYYLPMEPYADAALTHLRFDQLLDFCRETGTRAVMFYVAFRTDWYYMPDTPEHAERWAAAMAPFVRRLREEGISYQLNFQNLLGSIDHRDAVRLFRCQLSVQGLPPGDRALPRRMARTARRAGDPARHERSRKSPVCLMRAVHERLYKLKGCLPLFSKRQTRYTNNRFIRVRLCAKGVCRL